MTEHTRKLLHSTGAQLGAPDDLEGWEGGGGRKRERIYVYLKLIHIAVQHKPSPRCKAITLQLKRKQTTTLLKLNIPISYDLAIPLLGIYSTETSTYAYQKKYMNVHSCFIHNK